MIGPMSSRAIRVSPACPAPAAAVRAVVTKKVTPITT
jgi:hypothetical protein